MLPHLAVGSLLLASTTNRRPAMLVDAVHHGLFRQVHEAHAVVEGLAVEKVELLLVAQHLQRWLAQHREIQRWPLHRGQRKHHLVCQRGFATTGLASGQVERELRQTAARHLVQPGYACGQAVDGYFGHHGFVSCALGLFNEVSGGPQEVRSRRSVREPPIRLVSNPWKVCRKVSAAAAASSLLR
jgi:hypothetical protein